MWLTNAVRDFHVRFHRRQGYSADGSDAADAPLPLSDVALASAIPLKADSRFVSLTCSSYAAPVALGEGGGFHVAMLALRRCSKRSLDLMKEQSFSHGILSLIGNHLGGDKRREVRLPLLCLFGFRSNNNNNRERVFHKT